MAQNKLFKCVLNEEDRETVLISLDEYIRDQEKRISQILQRSEQNVMRGLIDFDEIADSEYKVDLHYERISELKRVRNKIEKDCLEN